MPKLQMYLGQLVGIGVDYGVFDAADRPKFSLPVTRSDLRSKGYHGVNITQPFKQDAWHFIHRDKQIERRLGAYTTIKFSADKDDWFGASTDFTGFVAAFKRVMRQLLSNDKVLLAGAGGVGRAIAFGLAELKVAELYIFDTNIQQAQELAMDLPDIKCHVVSSIEEFHEATRYVDGLVNCTPKGMYYMPESAFDTQLIDKQIWAFDAVYTPLQTEFVKACQHAGVKVISGFDLWIHQGLEAFEIFSGMHVDFTPSIMAETLSWLD